MTRQPHLYIVVSSGESEIVEEEEDGGVLAVDALSLADAHTATVSDSAVALDLADTHTTLVTDSAVALDLADTHTTLVANRATAVDLADTHTATVADGAVALNLADTHATLVTESLSVDVDGAHQQEGEESRKDCFDAHNSLGFSKLRNFYKLLFLR